MFSEERHPTSKIFKNIGALYHSYIPSSLPHREVESRKLMSYFKPIVDNPGSVSINVLIHGPVGTGKTVLFRKFSKDIVRFSKKRKVSVYIVYINAFFNQTLFLIMQEVAKKLGLKVPSRGFSSSELISIIWHSLETYDSYLILGIDEVDVLLSHDRVKDIYSITRTSEEFRGNRISTVLILRDWRRLYYVPAFIKRYIASNVIELKPYTVNQIYDILYSRAFNEQAFKEGAVDEDILYMIAEKVGVDNGPGDARYAIDVLKNAGLNAEKEGRDRIIAEDVRVAFQNSFLTFTPETLDALKLHEKLFLLALTQLLRLSNTSYVKIGDVEEEYRKLCEDLGLEPRKHTAIWNYARKLKNFGIIDVKPSGKGTRGHTSLLGITGASLEILESIIHNLVEKDLKES